MKNTRKGFTLVELLAVIVILAIIMIIAIPSVLGTMTTARQKSFCEYVTKVYMAAQNKYMAAQTLGSSDLGHSYTYSIGGETAYVYDITKDLGLENVGDYKGYVAVLKPNAGSRPKPVFYVALHDSNYILKDGFYEYTEEPKTDALEDYTADKIKQEDLTGLPLTVLTKVLVILVAILSTVSIKFVLSGSLTYS